MIPITLTLNYIVTQKPTLIYFLINVYQNVLPSFKEFDFIIDDYDEIKDLSKCKDPVKRIITEWCLDDKGLNMLYKGNGVDRYPEFKLYKMIARCVHNHTPQAQLDRPEFDSYVYKGDLPANVIDIDKIPAYI